jgi:hypothetical protein
MNSSVLFSSVRYTMKIVALIERQGAWASSLAAYA